MKDSKIILHFLAILFLCCILFLIYKVIVSIVRRNRLEDFSPTLANEETETSFVLRFLFRMSSFLESLVIFNGIARTYDRYVDENSRLHKGIDYISIKLVTGMLFFLFYIFLSFLYKNDISVLGILLLFLFGFILPDFYCFYLSYKKKTMIQNHILNAIIIMNHSYKAGRSTEQAIMDVIERSEDTVQIEFKKVYNDIQLGISVSSAFSRMYERTNLSLVEEISSLFQIVQLSGVPVSSIFDTIEQRVMEEEKLMNALDFLHRINRLAFAVFAILPLLFVGYLLFFDATYYSIIRGYAGIAVILSLLILYLLYLLIIWRVARGRYR